MQDDQTTNPNPAPVDPAVPGDVPAPADPAPVGDPGVAPAPDPGVAPVDDPAISMPASDGNGTAEEPAAPAPAPEEPSAPAL